jgi:hypothetical protein
MKRGKDRRLVYAQITTPLLLCALRNMTYPEARSAFTLTLPDKVEDAVHAALSSTSSSLCDILEDAETAYLHAINARSHHVAPMTVIKLIKSREVLRQCLDSWGVVQAANQQDDGKVAIRRGMDEGFLLDEIKCVMDTLPVRHGDDEAAVAAGAAPVLVKILGYVEKRLCEVCVFGVFCWARCVCVCSLVWSMLLS